MALEAGTVVRTSDPDDPVTFAVNLGGVLVDCRWDAGFTPVEGDTVYVERSSDRALARPFAASAHPLAATVSSGPSAGTVGVIGDDGITYRARYGGTAPATSERVGLMWQGLTPIIVVRQLESVPTDTGFSPGPTKPPTPSTGVTSFPAIASGTGRPYGWQAGDVRQGAYGSNPVNRGAFFNGSMARLAGATITRLRLRLGPRVRVGSYNATVTANFYRHTSTSAGTDVARAAGPHSVPIPANWGGGDIDLPVSWGAGLIAAGGGIALGSSSGSGDDYMGFGGINARPDSGLLIFNWRR